MGTPKALLPIGADTFVDRLAGIFHSVVDPVIVVLGHDWELVSQRMRSHSPVTLAINPEPERGMLSSFQCGLRELPPVTEAVIFTPVDYPNCRSATVARLADEFRAHSCDVVIPICQGVKGHPVCISRRVVGLLLGLPGTSDARDVIRQHRSTTVFVEVDDPGITTDIDTPEDYRALVTNRALPSVALS